MVPTGKYHPKRTRQGGAKMGFPLTKLRRDDPENFIKGLAGKRIGTRGAWMRSGNHFS